MEYDTGLVCSSAIRLQGTVWEPKAGLEEHSEVRRSGHPWFLSGSSVLPVIIATGFTEGYFRQEFSGLI